MRKSRCLKDRNQIRRQRRMHTQHLAGSGVFEAQFVCVQEQTACADALPKLAVQIEGAIHIVAHERQPT